MINTFKKLFMYSNENSIVQFLRYVIVGGFATIIDFIIYTRLVTVMDIKPVYSNSMSLVVGMVINYFLSRKWVFNKQEHNAKKDLLMFILVGFLGLAISDCIIYLLIDKYILKMIIGFLSEDGIKIVAKVISTVIVLFWNFIARKKFVF